MSKIFFNPWIGDNYQSGGIFKKKILVLGEAHICDAGCTMCGNPEDAVECGDFTQRTMEVILRGETHRWTPTFFNLIRRLFCLILLSAVNFSIFGSTEIDGIYYDLNENKLTSSVTSGGYAYSGEVVIPYEVTYNGKVYSVTAIGDQAFSGCSNLTSIELPNSVTSIGESAFYGCTVLTSIDIPNTVTTIGASAFRDCKGLISIELPISVTDIHWCTFYGCSSLISVELPNSVTYIGGYAFSNCRSLISIKIPNAVRTIGYYTFAWCSGLKSIELPDSLRGIEEAAFDGCSSLTSIELPDSVTTIEKGAFRYCSGLMSIVLPNSVRTIGEWAFDGCGSLTSIELPNSLRTIGNGAFYGCSGLTSLELPNSVTTIGDYAFESCGGLASIELPNSVTTIGREVFSGCTRLKDVYYESLQPIEGDKNMFSNTTYFNATLWVPQEAVELCFSINPWQNFSDIKPYVFSSGVEDIVFSPEEGYEDDVKELTEVFTLDGVKVSETQENLAPGVYVIRKGSETKKIVVK